MSVVDRLNRGLRRVPTWPLYLLLLVPAPWYLYLAQSGALGREPIKALEHELGQLALRLLVLTLCVTPLRRFVGLNLLKFRRMLGVMAFVYVCLHLAVWIVLDMNLLWGQMWGDVLKRPYITIGMAAFVLLIPLALTSNAAAVRRLGAETWRRLHWLAYPATVLGAVHFVWLVKGIQLEPLIYLAVILALLALRSPIFAKKR